jgi:predicted RNase H-like HicB family nuclease
MERDTIESMEKYVLNYRIIIEKEADAKGRIVFVAQCPTLGISDYGDTVEEVLESIQDGIELAVETLSKEGQEIPVDKIDEQIITSTKVHISTPLPVSFA